MMSKRIFIALIIALAFSLFVSAAEINSADDMLTLMNTPSMWADDYVLTKDINLIMSASIPVEECPDSIKAYA